MSNESKGTKCALVTVIFLPLILVNDHAGMGWGFHAALVDSVSHCPQYPWGHLMT